MFLSVIGVGKNYGKPALIDVNLEIEKGKIYGLLGPNGCGKSTLMKAVAGLVRVDKGNIVFQGIEVGKETKSKIAYMPTEPFFYGFMTGRLAGKYYEDFFNDFEMDVYLKLLEEMEVDVNQKIITMSSGQVAKLKVALTMARKAELYMLDEPLNGIDLIARDKVMSAVLSRIGEENSIIISSHLVDELEQIIEAVIMMGDGRIIIDGDCETIRIKEDKSITDLYRSIYGEGGAKYV